MNLRAPLIAGTILSLAVVSAWSYMASLAIGPAAPLHLSRNLSSDRAQLAAAVAFTYAACLLASGWRRRDGGL